MGQRDGVTPERDGGEQHPGYQLLAELAAAVGGGAATAATYYARASDRMRGVMGNEVQFARAIGNDRYSPLVNGAAAQLVEVMEIGDSARGTVAVQTSDGQVTFVFAVALAKSGDRQGEWCLSGIAREGVDL